MNTAWVFKDFNQRWRLFSYRADEWNAYAWIQLSKDGEKQNKKYFTKCFVGVHNTIIRGRVGGCVRVLAHNGFIGKRRARERFTTSYKAFSEEKGFEKSVLWKRLKKKKKWYSRGSVRPDGSLKVNKIVLKLIPWQYKASTQFPSNSGDAFPCFIILSCCYV